MDPDCEQTRTGRHGYLGIRRVFIVFLTMGIVGLLLGAEPLYLHADRLSPSPLRTAAVTLTGPLAAASEFLLLDRPWEWASGYVDPEENAYEVTTDGFGSSDDEVIGSLFTPVVSTTSTVFAGGANDPTTTTVARVASSTTTTTVPEQVFTAEDPLRVLVVGDSLVVMMGYGLTRQTKMLPAMDVEAVTKVSSGLSRPDFYDWPKVLAENVAEYKPHVTVILFGGNDKQTIRTQGKALKSFSYEWFSEYYQRISSFLDIITDAGGEAIWVGLPVMRSDTFSETCRTLNFMYSTVCENHEAATYVDGYSLFQDEQGKYNAYLVDSSGERKLMREGDGIHFTNAGGDRQAEAVMKVLLGSHRLEP